MADSTLGWRKECTMARASFERMQGMVVMLHTRSLPIIYIFFEIDSSVYVCSSREVLVINQVTVT